MITYLKRLLTDEGAFVGMFRSAFVAVGVAVQSGELPLPESWPTWAGSVLIVLGMMMRSSVPANKKADS